MEKCSKTISQSDPNTDREGSASSKHSCGHFFLGRSWLNSKQSISYLASQCPQPPPNKPEFVVCTKLFEKSKTELCRKGYNTYVVLCPGSKYCFFFIHKNYTWSQMRISVESLPGLLRTSLQGLGELLLCRKRIPGKDLIFWQT